MIFIIPQFTAGIQPYLVNEVRKLHPCVGFRITVFVVLPTEQFKHSARILSIVKLQTDEVSWCVSVCQKKINVKIKQTLRKHSFLNTHPRGLIFFWLAVSVIAIWRTSQGKMLRDKFHTQYMLRLEVVCVLFSGISAWIDSLLLNPLQSHAKIC